MYMLAFFPIEFEKSNERATLKLDCGKIWRVKKPTQGTFQKFEVSVYISAFKQETDGTGEGQILKRKLKRQDAKKI